MQYDDFYELKEIGFGGYGTVYTARHVEYSKIYPGEDVVLKRIKNFDKMPELFITEVNNN